MKLRFVTFAAATLLSVTAFAQTENHFKFFGFIRNYLYADTHTDNISGAMDLFYYSPKDTENNQMTFNYANLATRLGVDVSGYEFNGLKMGAKVETDFYAGLTGATGTALLCLRQAYLNLAWTNGKGVDQTFKMGQAWHPMAADMPETISINTGAPFGPFSRTPLGQYDVKFNKTISLTTAAIWQMQYPSCGPEGTSANYLRYCGIPEIYLGVNFTSGGFLGRLGVDYSAIRPYRNSKIVGSALAYAYFQYVSGDFSIKAKSAFAQNGSHLNLAGGYAVTGWDVLNPADASQYEFTNTTNSTTWINVAYGKKVRASLYAGYIRNFGFGQNSDTIILPDHSWFCKNGDPSASRLVRVSPQVVFTWGKLVLGLEVEYTAAQYDYGKPLGITIVEPHWVSNTRLQSMLQFTF